MDSDEGVDVIPVPWGRLKAWIEAQEKAERSGYNPSPPTKVQVAALSHLVDFMDEPEPTPKSIGKLDYVSELMQLAQAKSVAPPRFQDLAPIEVPVGGVLSQRWRTVCTLPFANNKEFPCVGYGLREGKLPPLSKSKKLSKQYAAKYAFLYAKSHFGASTPSNGGAPVATNTSPPARNPTPPDGNNNENNNVSVGRTSSAKVQAPSGGAPISPSSTLPSPSSSTGDLTNGGSSAAEDTDFYDTKKLPSLLDQVKKETKDLKLGYPIIEIFPDPETQGMYAGKPIFKNNSRIPEGLGYIKGALTKGLAKELVAEEILKYCKAQRKRLQGLMNTFNPQEEE
ncbi:hypothetical protein LI328DRAFT_125334 [Trichoderma asperelloides]|nr:hypothetical protein LI328DRAFT_125334 [Trichoderma asperelloides]